MASPDKRLIKARLDAAARRWEWEDRQRGVTYYRGTKPHRRGMVVHRYSPATNLREFAYEAAMVVAASLALWVLLNLLLSF